MSDLSDLIKNEFQQKKIVIVGDLVADQFLRGTIARVSREAPVFILRHDETETFPGGAANAAVNVAALGGDVSVVGLIGTDKNGKELAAKLVALNVDCRFAVSSEKWQTTTKVRVLAAQHYAQRQQVIRIDYENQAPIDEETKIELIENLKRASENADAIIFSDYNYGVADAPVFEVAARLAAEKRIPLLVDSRFRLGDFPNATSATPNQEEVEQILGANYTDEDCENLREKLGFEALLVTCGNKGMLLVEKNKKPLQIEAVGAKEPVDVTGAGDTVIAVYSLGLACGLSFGESARIANAAGGIVVMKKGTAAVGADELLNALRESAQTTNA
jgi:rfaE bifunctional protein kinase chain/domain